MILLTFFLITCVVNSLILFFTFVILLFNNHSVCLAHIVFTSCLFGEYRISWEILNFTFIHFTAFTCYCFIAVYSLYRSLN